MTARKFLASLDMYRKVPADLLEGTKRGSALSILSLLTMITLIFLETGAYFQTQLVTELKLDVSNKEKETRVAFNITMMDLKCDFLTIDQVSVFGAEQNIRNHYVKRSIDGEGMHKFYQSKQYHQNRKHRDMKKIDLYDPTVTETLDDLHKNGVDAVQLTPDSFEEALKEHQFVFVDFYAK